jgi:hypothetical protein
LPKSFSPLSDMVVDIDLLVRRLVHLKAPKARMII